MALAAIAFVATAAVGIASYRLTQQRLMAEIDRSLTDVEGRWLRDQRGRELIDLDRLPTRARSTGSKRRCSARRWCASSRRSLIHRSRLRQPHRRCSASPARA